MIGTIRKHSKWLWWIIAGATIISFVLFMGTGPARNGNGSGSTINTNEIGGTIYGEKVTPEKYYEMKHDVYLRFLFSYGGWPDRNPNFTKEDMRREIYVRMMLVQKANDMGIHVGNEQVEQMAATFLRSPELVRALGVRGQSVPFDTFVKQILEPEGLSAADFENFIRNDLTVEQLQLAFGLPGQLVTPQEAAAEYVRENQELSAQIVYFSASNYLAMVEVTPDVVAHYYTNYMAAYRLPDRVQASYVAFSISNFLGAAEQKLSRTNLDTQVSAIYAQCGLQVSALYAQYGLQTVPDAKTPDEAKTEIRKFLVLKQAFADAYRQADEFAQAVFNIEPAAPENLSTVARQKGLAVQTTGPFSQEYGPEEFVAPAAFTKTAFGLTPDSPISEPVASRDAIYIIALDKQLPSEIPPLDQIRERVTQDLQLREATLFAQRAGTNFIRTLAAQMAAGKSFAAASIAAGFPPEVLSPFSLSTQELPDLDEGVSLNQLKEAALTTPVGRASGFEQTDDGGFVIFVQSQLPVDESKMSADLAQFTAELRQHREQDTFNEWLQREGSRELRNTPIFKEAAGAR